MKALLLLAVTASVAMLVAQEGSLISAEQAAQGWVALFDGESLFGWTEEGPAKWKVADGTLTGDAGEYGWLRHNVPFRDFELHCEFQTSRDGNSGIYLRAMPHGLPHLTGYEIQISDRHDQYKTGSIVGYKAAIEGAIKHNEWQSFDLAALGGRIIVKLDGKVVSDNRDGKSLSGYLGLQFARDGAVRFRNIRLRPLRMLLLGADETLSGWYRKDAGIEGGPKWSVQEGMFHLDKGPGLLESERSFGDYVAQMEIRKDAGEFSTRTVAWSPRNGYVWMNGIPAKGTDNSKVGESADRVKAGIIRLEANDPAVSVDFRNIRVAELAVPR